MRGGDQEVADAARLASLHHPISKNDAANRDGQVEPLKKQDGRGGVPGGSADRARRSFHTVVVLPKSQDDDVSENNSGG